MIGDNITKLFSIISLKTSLLSFETEFLNNALGMAFNSSIIAAAIMELLNAIPKALLRNSVSKESNEVFKEIIEKSLVMLSPIIPHVCHELWESLGKITPIHNENWPAGQFSLWIGVILPNDSHNS